MRKTPSYLKGLAETRARVSAEVTRLETLHAELTTRLEGARQELSACDTLIKKFDARLEPSRIQPVKAWKGKYGQRGALKLGILEYLSRSAPEAVSTQELCLFLQQRFGLEFGHWRERLAWKTNTVLRQLRRYADEGLVERLQDVAGGDPFEVCFWRLVSKAEAGRELLAHATVSGGASDSAGPSCEAHAGLEGGSLALDEDSDWGDEGLPV